jgi:hypothetical protein
MDINDYAIEKLAEFRLDELRAEADRRQLLALVPSASVRERVGRGLIRFGAWLVATAPARPAPDSPPEWA